MALATAIVALGTAQRAEALDSTIFQNWVTRCETGMCHTFGGASSNQWATWEEQMAVSQTMAQAIAGAATGAGDPVNGAGEFVIADEQDLVVPGFGMSLAVSRTYRSQSKLVGPLGLGWDLSLHQRLTEDTTCGGPDAVYFSTGRNATVKMRAAGTSGAETTYTPEEAGVGMRLTKHANPPSGLPWSSFPWRLQDESGVDRYFDAAGNLRQMIDRQGHRITFQWILRELPTREYEICDSDQLDNGDPYVNCRTHWLTEPVWRVASVTDTRGSTFHLRYDMNDRYLTCITEDPSTCTGALVTYGYGTSSSGKITVLTSVQNQMGHGPTYEYDLAPRHEKDPYVASDDVHASCDAACGVTEEHSCTPTCNYVKDVLMADSPAIFRCHSHDECQLEQDKADYCFEPTAAACYTACVAKLTNSNATQYGRLEDLVGNMTVIRDPEGRLVVSNTYGQVVTQRSFDKVVSQEIGGVTGHVVTWGWHDLEAEHRQYLATGQSLPGFDYANVKPTRSYVGTELCACSAWDTDGRCITQVASRTAYPFVSSSGRVTTAAVEGQVHPYDGPAYAVVISDYRGSVRTQYFTSKWKLIRDVEHHQTDGEGVAQHDMSWEGTLMNGERGPTGQVTCKDFDAFARPLQVRSFPRPGSSEQPDVSQHVYTNDGLPWVSVAHATTAPVRTVWDHYPNGLVKRIEQDAEIVNGSVTKWITYYDYPQSVTAHRDGVTFQVAPWAPRQVTSPDETVRYTYCGTAFGTVSATCAPAPSSVTTNPEGVGTTTYALHDFYGRVLQSGTPDAYVTKQYDLSGRLEVSEVVVAGVGTEVTTRTYTDRTLRPSKIRGPRAEVSYGYDVYGHTVWTRTRALDGTAPTRTECQLVDLLDGRVRRKLQPEGELEIYRYDNEGRLISVDRGYPTLGQMNEPWAALCLANIDGNPDPDKGATLGQFVRLLDRSYTASGLLIAEVAEGLVTMVTLRDGFDAEVEVRDGLGNRTRAGFDVPNRTAWVATLAPGTSPFQRPDPSLVDPALSGFAETRFDLMGREIRRETWRFAYGVPLGPQLGVVTTTQRTCPNRDPAQGPGEPRCAVTVTEAAGTMNAETTTRIFDGAGRLIETRLPGLTTPITSAWVDPYHVADTFPAPRPGMQPIVTHRYLDARYLPRNVKDASGTELLAVVRDVQGRVVSATEIGGRQGTITRDAFGQVTEVRQKVDQGLGTNQRTSRAWDRAGRLVSVTDGRQNVTRFHHDALGRRYRTIDADGVTHEVVEFDGASDRPRRLLDLPSDTVTELDYDLGGRLLREEITHGHALPAGSIRKTLSYDLHGLHTATIDSSVGPTSYTNTTTLEHDSLGNTLSEHNDALGDFFAIFEVADVHGQRTETTVGNARIERAFSPLGMTDVSVNGRAVATLSYASPGLPYRATYGEPATTTVPQVREEFMFDDYGRIRAQDVMVAGPSVHREQIRIAHLRTVYGRDGVPRARVTQHGDMGPVTTYFQADLLGRVIAEERRDGETTLVKDATNANVASAFGCATPASSLFACDPNQTMTAQGRVYLLDATDNLTRITHAQRAVTYDFGSANEITLGREFDGASWQDLPPVTYDPAGSVLSSPIGHTLHDAQGMLLASDDEEYQVDALGRRILEIGKDGVTFLVWSGASLLVVAEAPSANPPKGVDDLTRMAVHVGQGLDTQYAEYDAIADTLEYIHQGPDLSVLARTSPSGLIEGYVYSAFGEVTVVDHHGEPIERTPRGRRLFQGQLYEPKTGTFWMRARSYDPKTGRFTSRDPVGVAGGLNLYSFVGARPLTHADPFGRSAVPATRTTNYPEGTLFAGKIFAPSEVVETEKRFEVLGNGSIVIENEEFEWPQEWIGETRIADQLEPKLVGRSWAEKERSREYGQQVSSIGPENEDAISMEQLHAIQRSLSHEMILAASTPFAGISLMAHEGTEDLEERMNRAAVLATVWALAHFGGAERYRPRPASGPASNDDPPPPGVSSTAVTPRSVPAVSSPAESTPPVGTILSPVARALRRDIVVVQTARGPRGFYRSTGDNSGEPGVWFPMYGFDPTAGMNGMIVKPTFGSRGLESVVSRRGWHNEYEPISNQLGSMNIPTGQNIGRGGINPFLQKFGAPVRNWSDQAAVNRFRAHQEGIPGY